MFRLSPPAPNAARHPAAAPRTTPRVYGCYSTRWRAMTLSLAGSTSRRLDAARNSFIQVNIEIGRDCLEPIPHAVR